MNNQAERNRSQSSRLATKAHSGLVATIVVAAFAASASAQRVSGSVAVVVPAPGRSAVELAAQQEFQLRRMGYDEDVVSQNRQAMQDAAAKEAAGLSASGEFEYARDGEATFLRTVGTTTIPGQSRSVVTERFDGGNTIIEVDGQARVYPGDGREMASSPVFDVALLGLVPAGFESESSTGGETVYGRPRNDLLERLVVRRDARGEITSFEFGYVTPEQYRKPGQPAFSVVASGTRSSSGREVDLAFYGGAKVVQMQQIRLDGEPSASSAKGWPTLALGTPVVDMRGGEGRTANYAYAGKLPGLPGSSQAQERAGFPAGLAWVGGGVVAVLAGRSLTRRR
ncbi:MAG: hypothetical protein IT207_11090 [Fimbriimonadaceae bacterium]|nr:hypothetical protein [Fimbriimonadaceae bacterium]